MRTSLRSQFIALIALLPFCTATGMHAATFNVNSFSDTHAVTPGAGTGMDSTGKISLRSALEAINQIGGTQTVILPAGTYNLSLGMITFGDVAQNVTITGASAATTIVNMTTTLQNRIFLIITTGTLPNVITSINNVQFTGGKLTGDNYGGGAIIAGGPSNSLTLTNCIFQNNSIAAAVGGSPLGGAVRYNGGGTLTITGCVFTNNSNPLSAGGAVSYFLENLASAGSGAVSITNSTFTNNSVTATGATGGALDVAAQGRLVGGVTFGVSVLRNTFSGNSASGSSGSGGAISVTNSFDVGNTAQINNNRIFGNTSNIAPSAMAVAGGSQGNVNATDNWWGVNTGPGTTAAKTGAGGGTFSLGTWLQLRHSASPTTILTSGTSTLTADILGRNSGGPISAATLTGLPAFPASATTIFSNAVKGTLSGASTQFVNGQATAMFTAGATGGAGSADALVDGQSAITAAITINQPPAITSANSANFTVGVKGSFTVTTTGSPNPSIARTGVVLPSGVTFTDNGNGTGTLSGTPGAGNGGTYSITFTASNGVGSNAVQSFTFKVNGPPVVSNIAKSGNEDTQITFTAANFDAGYADPNSDPLVSVRVTSLPANGTLKLSGVNVTVNQDIPRANLGNPTFDPVQNFNGGTSFGWNGSDGTFFATPSALVNITVNPVNDAPNITGQAAAISTSFNTGRAIAFADLTVTDVDNTYPTGFTLTVSNGANYTRSGNTVTPATGFYGTLSVPVKVNDGAADSNTLNLVMTVNPDPEVAKNGTRIAREPGGGYRITFIGNPGATYTIQFNPTLNPANWQLLGTRAADANGSYNIVDIPPANTPTRFYRSILP